MLNFRKAAPEDLPGILTVVSQARAFMASLGIDQWQDGYPSSEILSEDIRVGRAYVHDGGGAIASICVLTSEHEPVYDAIDGAWHVCEPCMTLHRMAVDDAHRHSGLAADILKNVLDLARRQGLRGLRADTHRENVAMRRFLEKNGFQFCGVVSYPVQAGDPLRAAYDRAL